MGSGDEEREIEGKIRMEEERKEQEMMKPPVVEEENKKKMKVLVAIDESEGSFYALNWTIHNLFNPTTATTPTTSTTTTTTTTSSGDGSDQTPGGEGRVVVLLHVQQPFQHYMFPAGPAVYATTSVVESVRKAQEENSALLLSRALQMCKESAIKAETLILDGDPKDMICQAAEEIRPGLVVVGSRGLGKIKRAFLGSVSDYCAHHAKCPILIVKPPK